MVHYGKHIIDEETGLCEICDRGAIFDYREGKRPGRQFLYSNKDGKFTYRPSDEEAPYNPEETRPRYVRKPLYPEPPPARTRPAVHEEPVVQKKVRRRHRSPVEDPQNPPTTRLATVYYVDGTGQTMPRQQGHSDETPRRQHVQNHHSPPTTRSTRPVQRRAQTPPPPASESWRSPPKRQINSDTQILHRQPQTKSHNGHGHHSPRGAEMYYIEQKSPHKNTFTTISSQVQGSNDHYSPPLKNPHQGDPYRKQRQLEPIERKHYNEPEPTVARKVYKKLPANRHEHPAEEHVPNGHQPRLVRKVEKIYPSPRTYDSSPQSTNTHVRNPLPNQHPSVYYLRSTDEY